MSQFHHYLSILHQFQKYQKEINMDCSVNVLNKLADKSQFIHINQTTSHSNPTNIIPHHNEFNSLSPTNQCNNLGSQLIDIPNYIPTSSSNQWSNEFHEEISPQTGNNETISAPQQMFQSFSTVPTNRFNEQSYDYYNVMSEYNEPRSMEIGQDLQDEFDELEKELAHLDLTKDETANLIDDRELFRDTATDIYATMRDTNSNSYNSMSIGTQSKLAGSKFLNMMKLISSGSVNLNQTQTELCSMTTNEPIGNKYIPIPDKSIR